MPGPCCSCSKRRLQSSDGCKCAAGRRSSPDRLTNTSKESLASWSSASSKSRSMGGVSGYHVTVKAKVGGRRPCTAPCSQNAPSKSQPKVDVNVSTAKLVENQGSRIDELLGIHTKLEHLQDKMAKIQAEHEEELEQQLEADEESVCFPPTYIVLKFSTKCSYDTILWVADKVRGKRRNGGAELLVRKQPEASGLGIYLHVSASKIKFLELAEELELKKRDCSGLIREFTVADMERFICPSTAGMDGLLTTADKQYLINHELQNIRALPGDKFVLGFPTVELYEGQSIIQVCLNNEIIERLYPLHDTENLNRLGKMWYMAFFEAQPFEEIRMYFGESIALYFSFLGFYTTALIAPMFLGFLQLFLGTETIAVTCIFNLLWVTIFLEVWKRKCNELAYAWGTIDMQNVTDEPRPNFQGDMAEDFVTGRVLPHYPRWKINVKTYGISFPIVFLCLLGAFWVMLIAFWAEEYLVDAKQMYGSRWAGAFILIPSIVYTVLVYIMNMYYRKLATHLTEWENHRTQSQFDKHRVIKLVMFEFVNNFMSLFYIAFYIQNMDMLKNQLAIMLIILQAINNFQEAILPLILRRYVQEIVRVVQQQLKVKGIFSKPERRRAPCQIRPDTNTCGPIPDVGQLDCNDPRIEQAIIEGKMESYEGTYDDYLEMFIQFGYVFLFSAVYPMAAFWAVFNNILEIRADAFKLCRVYQRPLTKRVKDIGAWQRAFETLGIISVLTNCILLGMSPNLKCFAPHMSAADWIILFVILEHVLLAIKFAIHEAIPDRPDSVKLALAKTAFQTKQALKQERLLKTRRQLTRKFKSMHCSCTR